MKIAFVGSRTFCDEQLVRHMVNKYMIPSSGQVPYNEFVSGGAIGPDTWAWDEARKIGVICWVFPPDWIKHGKSAGFIRNKEIVRQADVILAFWDGKSSGTKSTIDLAVNAGKPVNIYIRRPSGS